MPFAKRGYSQNGFKYFTNVTTPQETFVQFTVTPTNGLGVTSVKSNGYVRNVFMHTSTTPAANNGYTNPNPADGYAYLQFMNNFNKFMISGFSVQSPVTGSVKIDNSALTPGAAYVISTLGDASLAKWQAIGVPPGVTPAVGVSFIALSDGGSGNVLTSRVSTPLSSGITGVEIVGNPDVMLNSSNQPQNAGAWLMLQFLNNGSLSTHTHDFVVIGGQAASTTNNIAAYAGPIIGKEAATNATFAGANSASNGGVVAASAGSISTVAAAPTTGSIISLRIMYDASSDTIDGL